jgi:hypothetical protein
VGEGGEVEFPAELGVCTSDTGDGGLIVLARDINGDCSGDAAKLETERDTADVLTTPTVDSVIMAGCAATPST